MQNENDYAIVLSGGGARGAYQAGSLRALYELCKEAGNFLPFRNLVGVSAGAINAAFPDVTFGAVSLQLRALAKAGLVSVRPAGRHRYYRVHRERLGPVGELLEQMWADALWRLKVQAEFESTRRGPRPRQTANRRQAGLPDAEEEH